MHRINQTRRTLLKVTAGGGLLALSSPYRLGAEQLYPKGPVAIVIGAGIAGLSAAYELKKSGFDVAIFEKENFIGGRMREGWMGPLYQFTHAVGVLDSNREMFALAAELGIENELHGKPFTDIIDNGYGTYRYALDFHIDELLKIPGMSSETKQRLPLLQADLDEIRETVDPCLIASGANYDDESLGEYYERKLGKQAADELIRFWIEPVCSAAGWPVYQTSKIALLPWLSQQQARFVYPKGGIGVLTRKLGSILPVQTQTTVRYITPPDSSGRHTIHYLTPELERRSITPDIVVCTTEGKYLPKLVQGLSPMQESFTKNIYFSKEAIVCYILDEKYAPEKYRGGSYTPSHPDPIKAKTTYWFVTPTQRDNYNNLLPAHARYALSRQETPKWQVSNQGIEEYCLPMMQYFYPSLKMSMVKDIVNYTCDDLIYIPTGYAKQAAGFLREQARARRGLYFAGEYLSGGHTGAACASGRSIARLIIRQWA